ncbi:hypothetical protein D9619_009821 [Psilocybe cf. subviscida]|uniref:DUF6535 domain-containing protein n=1 Tax=Psilocybe cf. subviscida TaxID=2480587 RepID=A0A8H5F6H6_9AGAR|nr:hypothetical protein D9619_009821 [Psilocybe cf. subviscida]
MSSKPGIATVENTSEVEGPGMQAQGGAIGINPVPQATNPNDNPRNHDIDILQEEKMTEHDAMPSLLPGDAELNPQKPSDFPGDTPHPELSDPRTTTRPDFDPFERLFKPMLEQDTVQCNAWKDEVQNILIFAGLFSAVVTAFIIESYQRLKPDPSDTIVSLLAHIAERLDNPSIGGTASVLSIISDTNLSPSRSDISINVFWFISLVFSLTAALIGIITLQWLREHQRYDNTLKPQQMMAIFNERLDSLQQWYVPQIFAGLPLLLQGALVLFFAGMIEFLFALRLEVAVPVALSVCIPLVFLIATTVLPLLQVCILEDPFRLSVNNKVPSPCPYKSPQSLIFRRICVHSKTIFQFFTSIVTGTYACVILRYSVHLRENHSSSVTHLLHAFLEHCSKMPSNSQPVALLQPQATSASKSYGGIVAYMNTVVLYQTDDSLNDTLAHLILLCNLSAVPDLVQEKPFLMFAACFYLDATTTRHYRMPEAFVHKREGQRWILKRHIFESWPTYLQKIHKPQIRQTIDLVSPNLLASAHRSGVLLRTVSRPGTPRTKSTLYATRWAISFRSPASVSITRTPP